MTQRNLLPGVYVPVTTFFDAVSEDLDLETLAKHVVYVAQAGVRGIVVQGSNGEAVHLSRQERIEVVRKTREALDAAGFSSVPVIVGTGAQSTRETIQLTGDAAAAGGDAVLVLPPSYFKSNVPKRDLLQFFEDVADQSGVPVMIYNYPAVVGGIDLSAADILHLSQHKNIAGCKLTCGNVGKLQRIVAGQSTGFLAMGGLADITLPVLTAGGAGVIAGLANIAPRACVEVFEQWQSHNLAGALKAQAIVAEGDWAIISGGVPGLKCAMQASLGYGGYGRRPLPRPSSVERQAYVDSYAAVVQYEQSLQ